MDSSSVLAEVHSNIVKPSLEEQKVYNKLVIRAKQLADANKVPEALRLYKRAYTIYSAPSLGRKISKIEVYLRETSVQVKSECASPTDHRSQLPPTLAAVDRTSTVQSASLPPVSKYTDVSSSMPKSRSSMCTEDEKYAKLIAEAREAIENEQLEHALSLYKSAQRIRSGEKLTRRIGKIERYLNEVSAAGSNEEEEDCDNVVAHKANARVDAGQDTGQHESDHDGDMVLVGDGFYLHELLMSKLYNHQKEGVLWLWQLYKQHKGGILADDMGLGKTIQIIAFLSGLFDSQLAQTILIIMPVSLIVNWQKEFQKWAPGIPVYSYHGQSKKERERVLAKVLRRGGVILTSYGIVVANWESLAERGGKQHVWDCVILDEGHKIKNPTKTSKGVHGINARSRIVMTGTPVQNNLMEMWALFDFTHSGMLLGSNKTFKAQYENPITRARERCATSNEKQLGQEMAESLKRIISPYFLRRTKSEVNARPAAAVSEKRPAATMPSLKRKNDLIIWLRLSEVQLKIYRDFVQLDSVKQLLMSSHSPLTALTVLKKICDHPRLLSLKACYELGLKGEMQISPDALGPTANESAANQICSIDDAVLIAESGKLVFLVQLLDRLKEEGHRTLVFSQSRKMLDIIEKVMAGRGHKIMRLDGTVKDMQERDARVQKFQKDQRYTLFLLTSQVGGVGLTLTSASRVVIFDPSWNPATDSQAVDRAFRIGQQKNVVIYRFITCGSVEEKIYRRQVFKDSITQQATGVSKNPMRYFTRLELRDLFELDDPRSSVTQQQLEQMHAQQRKTDSELDQHIAYLRSCDMFGISDHDLMFSVEDANEEEAGDTKANSGYIQKRVDNAHQLIVTESHLQSRMNATSGKYVPEFLTQKPKAGGNKQKGGAAGPGGKEKDLGVQEIEQLSESIAAVNLDQIAQDDSDEVDVVDTIVTKKAGSSSIMSPGGTDPHSSALMQQLEAATDQYLDGPKSNEKEPDMLPACEMELDMLGGSENELDMCTDREKDLSIHGIGEPQAVYMLSQHQTPSGRQQAEKSTFALELSASSSCGEGTRRSSQHLQHDEELCAGTGLPADEDLLPSLPDFTYASPKGPSIDDAMRRMKLNRRSSCLPSLLKNSCPPAAEHSDSYSDGNAADSEDDEAGTVSHSSNDMSDIASEESEPADIYETARESGNANSDSGLTEAAIEAVPARIGSSDDEDDANPTDFVKLPGRRRRACVLASDEDEPTETGGTGNIADLSSCQPLLTDTIVNPERQAETAAICQLLPDIVETHATLPCTQAILVETSATDTQDSGNEKGVQESADQAVDGSVLYEGVGSLHASHETSEIVEAGEMEVRNCENGSFSSCDHESYQGCTVETSCGHDDGAEHQGNNEASGYVGQRISDEETEGCMDTGVRGQEDLTSSSYADQLSESDDEEEEDGSEDGLTDEFDLLSGSEDDQLPQEKIQRLSQLRDQAKGFYMEGDYRRSLRCLLKMLNDNCSERVQILALRLKEKISE